MEGSKRCLEVGDLCFAHVKTFPWWPARIVKTSTRKSKPSKVFSVLFFGTRETANLPEAELSPVTPSSIQKYVTKPALRRKKYEEAYMELLQEQTSAQQKISLDESSSNTCAETSNLPAIDVEKLESKEKLVSLSSLLGFKKSLSIPASHSSPGSIVDNGHGETEDSLKEVDHDSRKNSPKVEAKCLQREPVGCDSCGKTFRNELGLKRHTKTKHGEDSGSAGSLTDKKRSDVKSKKNFFVKKVQSEMSSSHNPGTFNLSHAVHCNKERFFSSLNLIPVSFVNNPGDSVRTVIEDDFDLFNDSSPKHDGLHSASLECDDCGKTFKTEVGLNKHCKMKYKYDTEIY